MLYLLYWYLYCPFIFTMHLLSFLTPSETRGDGTDCFINGTDATDTVSYYYGSTEYSAAPSGNWMLRCIYTVFTPLSEFYKTVRTTSNFKIVW